MPRFDQSKLTRAASDWLDDYFDLPLVPGLGIEEPRQEWLDRLLTDRISRAAGYAEVGWNDDRIEESLRDGQEREEAALRNSPKYHVGHHDLFDAMIVQTMEAIQEGRRRALRTVEATEAEKVAAEERRKADDRYSILSRVLGVG
jgi:hypothetical protein